MPISGHKAQFGVDTSANGALIQNRIFNTDSVNRCYRGGLNQTRPPFKEAQLFFKNKKEESLFRKSNVTGVFGYNAVYPYTNSHIIVTAGKYVFAGQLMNRNAYMTIIWDELDPTWANNYFCQAENILVISNGKDDPIFWDGQTDRMRLCKDSPWAKAPMPKFNAMVYAHGRIFGATEDGAVFAGDHLYSQGINASSEVVLSFNESTYPSSGDGFTAPASWGDLTGISVVQRNPSTNGHGEVVVFHLLGAYSINANLPRNQWTTEQVQQTVFTGIGGASPESIVTINNDIYFRCSNRSIASLRETIADFSNNVSFRPLSQEVSKYLAFDDFSRLRYSMAGISQNRALFTVNHQFEEDGTTKGIYHRFGLGLVSLDLHLGSHSVSDSRSWDGLWTGIRCTGIASLTIGKEKECFFCSFDNDKVNRVYYISNHPGDDAYYVNKEGDLVNKESQVESMYKMENLFDGLSTESRDSVAITTIKNSSLFYSNSLGIIKARGDFRSSFDINYNELYDEKELGREKNEDIFLYDPSNGSWNSPSTSSSARRGNEFALRTILTGSVNIHCNILQGESKADELSYSHSCPSGNSGYEDDSYYYFNYLIVNG
jgi:hypothetical protein